MAIHCQYLDVLFIVEDGWRVHAKVVGDEGEEPVGGVDKLGLASGSVLDHGLSLAQNLVSALDLFPTQLAKRHFRQVDLKGR